MSNKETKQFKGAISSIEPTGKTDTQYGNEFKIKVDGYEFEMLKSFKHTPNIKSGEVISGEYARHWGEGAKGPWELYRLVSFEIENGAAPQQSSKPTPQSTGGSDLWKKDVLHEVAYLYATAAVQATALSKDSTEWEDNFIKMSAQLIEKTFSTFETKS